MGPSWSAPRRRLRLTRCSRLPLAASRLLAGDDSVPPAPPRPGERPHRQDRCGRAPDACGCPIVVVRLRECSPWNPSARLWLAPCPPVGPTGQYREAAGGSEQSPSLLAVPLLRLRRVFSSQPKRSWLAGSDNGSRWRLCPTRYLSRPTGEPGGPEGDTPQAEAGRVEPTGVRRVTRLMDRRGRPPGPGGVRGAWEMAPRGRSAAQAPVNPGPPERREEQTMGPDHEGTTSPRPGKAPRGRSAAQAPVKPGSPERGGQPTMSPDHEGTRKNRRWVPTTKGRRGEKTGSPKREEERTTVPDRKGTTPQRRRNPWASRTAS